MYSYILKPESWEYAIQLQLSQNMKHSYFCLIDGQLHVYHEFPFSKIKWHFGVHVPTTSKTLSSCLFVHVNWVYQGSWVNLSRRML